MKICILTFLVFIATSIHAQQSISEARSKLGQSVTVSGIVTNGNEFDVIRYLQDNTAGIAAYSGTLADIEKGDSITITGTIKDYRNLLEIDPVSSMVLHSSGNTVPEPKVILIEDIGEDYEGQLIRINNVRIANSSGVFAIKTNYSFSQDGEQADFRVNSEQIAGQNIPAGEFDLIGICSQFSYNANDITSGYQVLPRVMDDFVLKGAVKITSPLAVVAIAKTALTLGWKTDIRSQSGIRFGVTNNPENWNSSVAGTSVADGGQFFNEVEISGLEPGIVVYAEGYSAVGNDTSFTSIKPFVTESNSSGEIKVYFNTEVDYSVSESENAVVLHNTVDDTLIAYIGRAKETIDLSVYNFNNSGISNITGALNDAKARGVAVRAVACGTTASYGLDNSGSDIPDFPVLFGPDDSNRDGLMHNKFFVFDAESDDANQPLVWTGSTNLTEGQINSDANNVIVVQDKALAAAYTLEFEEMWGGQGNQPEANNAKFGSLKADNTPHEFIINGKRVECYFSPSDGTNQKIIRFLESADEQIDIATMLITRKDIGNVIAERIESGVSANIITNSAGGNNTDVNSLLSGLLGDSYIFDTDASNVLHHKYALVDHLSSASDPQILTGSHNWSSSANEKNDENTLIIHDAEIANLYYQNFIFRFLENKGIVNSLNIPAFDNLGIEVYPNPVSSKLTISSDKVIRKVELFDIEGALVLIKEIDADYATLLNVEKLKSGMYFGKVYSGEKGVNLFKVVKN